ncbi:MAG: L-aspartate oxidase [Flavobacteriales bacterium]|nr:L-aspartate oxidase [Flavobacteriales bacterium]
MTRPLEAIVVGGGIAGMAFAIRLTEFAAGRPLRVRIISKAPVQVSSSYVAQGGMAAVIASDDRLEQHVQDTLGVGCGRNDEAVVRAVVGEGPDMVRWLQGLGAAFDTDAGGALRLAREGGHSAARVVHFKDSTGAEIVRVLRERMIHLPQVEVLENCRALDLIMKDDEAGRQCCGVRVLDIPAAREMELHADVVVLATGGAGQVYAHTTNPPAATGDGIAMAVRAAIALRDMAFVQFHPTALYTDGQGQDFLVSEAVRGAGARLLGADRRPLMEGRHPKGDLAPRNVVARTIHHEMMRTGSPHVWLDAAPIGSVRFAAEFPSIDRRCRALGLVPGVDLIPVLPAAHYLCGGIRTDVRGRTSAEGLIALGECAGTGLHGADRLASNSLLEALVVPRWAAEEVWETTLRVPGPPVDVARPAAMAKRVSAVGERIAVFLRHAMSAHVGIVREEEGLGIALRSIAWADRHLAPIREKRRYSAELLDLKDMLAVARAITEAAIREPLSVGAHYVEERAALV